MAEVTTLYRQGLNVPAQAMELHGRGDDEKISQPYERLDDRHLLELIQDLCEQPIELKWELGLVLAEMRRRAKTGDWYKTLRRYGLTRSMVHNHIIVSTQIPRENRIPNTSWSAHLKLLSLSKRTGWSWEKTVRQVTEFVRKQNLVREAEGKEPFVQAIPETSITAFRRTLQGTEVPFMIKKPETHVILDVDPTEKIIMALRASGQDGLATELNRSLLAAYDQAAVRTRDYQELLDANRQRANQANEQALKRYRKKRKAS